MRTIRIAIRSLAPLAAIMALMALPSVASAGMYWGEYDYDPIGGTSTSEDPVTADFSGTITVDDYSPDVADLTCEVAGEIQLSNDWDLPSGTAATNSILSIAPAQSVAQSCEGDYNWACQVSNVTFSGLPWSGTTDDFWSDFSDVSITTRYQLGQPGCAGTPTFVAAGDVIQSIYPYSDGGPEQGDCINHFEIYPYELTGGYPSGHISGHLELDLDSLEGLSTDDGGPCVTLNYL